MEQMNLTVEDLKDRIKNLPDDMEIIIPIGDEHDANKINGFRHVRTLGILSNKYEEAPALCFNTAADGLDISTQINNYGCGTTCDRVLF